MKKKLFQMLVGGAALVLALSSCGGGGGNGGGNDNGGGGGGGVNNTVPVANAGPDQNVKTGAVTTLDGSGSSDADNDPLIYQWSFVSKPDGSVATFSNPAVTNPTFVADVNGAYVVSLVVNDGKVNSTPATVTITASTAVYENTTRSGLIDSDEIWKGIIDITGDVTILSPATVTIEPGSTIRFSAGSDDQQGGSTTPITDPYFPHDPAIAPSQISSIEVFDGTLYAVGTPDQRITFTSSSQNAKPGDWHSLLYNKAGSKLILQYTTIEYGYYGIQVNDPATDSDITLKNNVIRNIVACGVCTGYSGIDPARSVTITISDNDISYCGHEGVDTHANANVLIENNIFHDGNSGVVIDGNNSIIRNNQFLRNHIGINNIGLIIDPNISDNTFVDNWADYCWMGACPYPLP